MIDSLHLGTKFVNRKHEMDRFLFVGFMFERTKFKSEFEYKMCAAYLVKRVRAIFLKTKLHSFLDKSNLERTIFFTLCNPL